MIAPEGFLWVEYQIAGQSVFIVTHYGRHLDEMAAVRLTQKYATPDFLDAHCQDGALYYGVGGGEFDDHRPEIVDGERQDCCATLVARALGVDDGPEWDILLRYVLQDDLNGPLFNEWILGKVVTRMNRFYMDPRMRRRFTDDSEIVTRWALLALDAKYCQNPPNRDFDVKAIRDVMAGLPGFDAAAWFAEAQRTQNYEKALFQEAERTFDQVVQVLPVPETDLKLGVAAQTENWQIPAVARRKGLGAIITRDGGGNTQVFTNGKLGVTLFYAAEKIQAAEQKARGQVDGQGNPWFYHQKMEALMNGSLTAWAPPTKLTLGQVVQMVKDGLRAAARMHRRAQPKQHIKVQR